MTLRELAEAMEEMASYLNAGSPFDRAWVAHLRSDAKSMRQLAQAERHMELPKPQPVWERVAL